MKQLTMTKVLTPLAALAFAFGVQAAVPSFDGFETETSTVVTNRTGWSFVYGTDGADDASAITAYGEAATPSNLPDGQSAGSNYLKLSTEDGTLFRNMDGANGDQVQLGSNALYVDTDVQFTVTDSTDRPEVTDGDKFIIWLEADTTAHTTNLCVWAKQFTAGDGSTSISNVYTLVDNANGLAPVITPGAWYRLTVKALSSVGTGSFKFPAFEVYLNGAQLRADGYIADENSVDAFKSTVGDETIVTDRKYLPAMAAMATLSKVGFSGEGALDNVVVTQEVPGFKNPTTLTFAWKSANITSVTLLDLGLTVANGGSVRIDNSVTSVDLAINGTNLSNYNLAIGGVEISNPASFTLLNPVSTTYNITATAKDTVNVRFELDEDSWGGHYSDIQSIMVGDLDVTAVLADPVVLKVLTNVTVSVGFSSSAAPVRLTSTDGNVTCNGLNLTVNAYGTGTATVKIVREETAATVNGQPFASFADALSHAKASGSAATIALAGNVALTEAAAIAAGEDITIDLAGNTISGAEDAAVFTVAATGALTITNSTQAIGAVVTNGAASACISNAGTLNLQAGKFKGPISGGTINVSGGKYSDDIAEANIVPEGYELRANTSPLEADYPYELFPLIVVTFDANGGIGTMAAQSVNYNTATALTANAFTKEGYTFAGWATASDGAVVYADQAEITATADTTLYAKWTIKTFTVTFDKNDNDATGTMSDQTFTYNVAQALTANAFTKEGYTFAGWATASDGEVVYADEASVTLTSAGLTLYAKWTQNAPVKPTIPENASTVEVAGDGSEDAATIAASVDVAKPAAASAVDDVTYQGYFTKTATFDNGKWTVKAEIAEKVEQNAATTAAAIVDGTSESGEVTVPAGLYYKVTTMTGLDGTDASSTSGLSTGAVEVTKPGTTQGFIKVQISTAPFAN